MEDRLGHTHRKCYVYPFFYFLFFPNIFSDFSLFGTVHGSSLHPKGRGGSIPRLSKKNINIPYSVQNCTSKRWINPKKVSPLFGVRPFAPIPLLMKEGKASTPSSCLLVIGCQERVDLSSRTAPEDVSMHNSKTKSQRTLDRRNCIGAILSVSSNTPTVSGRSMMASISYCN